NHLLRAVALPEGGHIVELRYEPPTLQFGMAVSVTTASILVSALTTLAWRAWLAHARQPLPAGGFGPAPQPDLRRPDMTGLPVNPIRMSQDAVLWLHLD
ncbi:MAG: hypothetical protein DCC58_20990, partial [Chloroflexi bacterium]